MGTRIDYLKEKRIVKIILLTILIVLGFDMLLMAQIGEIRGKVLAGDTKETLPFANVFVEVGSEQVGTTTDMDGRFVIKPLQAGKYNVTVSYLGYATQVISLVAVNPDKTTDIGSINLAASGITTKTFVVSTTSGNKLIDPYQGSITTATAAMIENVPGNRDLKNIIANIAPEVRVSEEGDVYIRGARSGSEAYYVDGMLVKDIDNAIPGTSISSMTVYTGGVPSQYGDLTSGVIVINTKGYFELYNEYIAMKRYKEAMKEIEEMEKEKSAKDSDPAIDENKEKN